MIGINCKGCEKRRAALIAQANKFFAKYGLRTPITDDTQPEPTSDITSHQIERIDNGRDRKA